MPPLFKRTTFKVSLILILCHIFLAALTLNAGAQSETLKLTILHMNDPHAHYSAESAKSGSGVQGGFAKAQSIIADITEQNRKDGRHTIFLLAGDLLTGTSYSTVFKGSMGVDLLNNMGLTAMVVGNHEFDYGMPNLMNQLKPKMNFPLLSANILDSKGERLFQPYIMLPFEGGRHCVFILGLTTTRTPVTTSPLNVKGLQFLDPVVVANEVLANAPKDCLVVALTHLGLKEDKLLAASCPRINVIIGGHTHTKLEQPLIMAQAIICQASAYAEFVGRLDIDFKDGKIVSSEGSLIPLNATIREDKKIVGLIDDYREKMGPHLQQPVGVTDVDLDGSRSVVRSDKPSDICRLIAGVMAGSVGADIALINGGAIRGGLRQGIITINDIYGALPFDDAIVKMNLSGEDIKSLLQNSRDLPPGSGGKLQSYGIEYSANDGKIEIARIRGEKFDPSKNYSIAVSEFLSIGGDGYTIFKERGQNLINSGLIIRDLLVNFIRDKKNITEQDLDVFRKS